MKSYHKSNFGKYADRLPCDLDGYVHTTIKGWMAAKMEPVGVETRPDKYEWAKDKAAEAKRIIAEVEELLAAERE